MAETAKDKVLSYMKETGMLTGTTRVIAGVSGGADSVFLFHVLREILAKRNIPFEVMHVHHGIRDEEADRDAAFVRALCDEHGVLLHLIHEDVPARAKAAHETLEEAGRNIRYAAFSKEAARRPGTKVALAHHKNDVAETMLFHLARGTGLTGLGSIRGVRDLYIRPLLAVTREEIEAELTQHHIAWCEDSTNAEDDAARNRIRHNVLPYLTEYINAQSVSHLAETARIAGEAADFIRDEAIRRASCYVREEDGMWLISSELVQKEPKLMQEEIIRMVIGCAMHTLKDISGLHVRLILELFARENGKFLNLPKGLTAEKRRQEVVISKRSSPKKNTRKHGRVIQ